jgi:hypothetical protein
MGHALFNTSDLFLTKNYIVESLSFNFVSVCVYPMFVVILCDIVNSEQLAQLTN